MEDQRFDELTRGLARPVSRRQLVKVLFATTVGGLFVRAGTGEAMAGNSDCTHFCNAVFPPGGNRGHCKSDAAQGAGVCAACGPAAPSGHPDVCAVGTQGVFCCPAAQPTCCNNASCAYLQNDVANCGACNHVCTGTTPACCSGVCKDLSNDVTNCGACGKVCSAGQICCGGKCIPACTALDQCHVAGVCDPSTQSCTNPPQSNGTVCVGTNQCFKTYTCQSGVCTGSNPVICTAIDQCHQVGTCDPTTGVCSNPTQPNGTICSGSNPCQTYACVAGVCTSTGNVANGTACGSGLTCCGGTCTRTSSDANNCGGCGNVCPPGETCMAGACGCGGTSCGPPNTCCNTQCVNPQTDPTNCGACGNVCPSGETCQSGTCTCPPSQVCGSTCCPTGQSCVNGACCPSTQACLNTCCATGELCCNNQLCIPATSSCCTGSQGNVFGCQFGCCGDGCLPDAGYKCCAIGNQIFTCLVEESCCVNASGGAYCGSPNCA
jgi:hypothetical protein